jgi:hypothetical protein
MKSARFVCPLIRPAISTALAQIALRSSRFAFSRTGISCQGQARADHRGYSEKASSSTGMASSAIAKQIAHATLVCLSYLLIGTICHAQTSFPGDFLGGLASGTFDTWGIATGDFNGDGKLDIATVSLNENTLNVFLGNGDGTFTGGFTYTFTGPNSPMSVIAADVHGEGKLDLIVTCYNSLNVNGGGTVSVFFGNGDGTFSHDADYVVNNRPVSVIAADFNGDGSLDLAATVNDAGTVAILINNEDGTFQAPVSYAASTGAYWLAVGDFNEDGNLDLAVTNYCITGQSPIVCTGSYIGTISVLLGNGDGTFQTASSFPAGTAPNGIAAAALSQGGNTDLLVTDASDGSLLVLLGNGNGTFQTPVTYPADAGSGDGSFLTTGDFNRDGKLDVIASGLSLVEFLGNGDGTLQQAVDYYRSSSGYPYFQVAGGDFNGDGRPDIAVGFNFVFSVFLNAGGTTRQPTTTTVQTINNGCGNATVTANVASGGQTPTGTLTLQLDGQYYTPAQFGSLNSSGNASLNLSALSVGLHTIVVVYSGDSLTQGSINSSSVNIQPAASSTALSSNPNPSLVGQFVTFTAEVTVPSSSQGCLSGSVEFLDGTTVLGSSQLYQGYASLMTSALAVGNHSITAKYLGSTYVAPSVSPVLVQVVGAAANVVFNPTSLSFPSTPVGQSSPAQPVTLTNTGTLPLTIASISASGDFSETNNCGTTVAGGQSCTINVTFTPTQGGARSGDITVDDNASSGQQMVPLTGTGLGPGITLSPSSLTFSNQGVGTTSPPQTVALTNSGNATLTISSLGITGPGSNDFGQTNNCGRSLVAGATCQIMVTFTPVSEGSFNAAISISDNLPGSPQLVPLSGSTLPGPGVSLSPSSISFSSQYVGTSGLPQTVTLTNTGNAALTITAINTTAADFGELSTCGNSVAVGASCSIGVFFDPTATGTRSGALTITDNAPGSPQSVPLTGTGQDFSLAPGSQSSATVAPGQTASYQVAVAPGGGFDQTVSLSCGGAPAQSTCSVSPSSVKLSGSAATATVTVTTAGGSAGLTQPINGPGSNMFGLWVALSGALGLAMMLSLGRWGRERRPPRLLYRLAFLCLLSAGVTMSACGGGNSGRGGGGTQAGTYNLTVTGTFTSGSTNLTHKTNLTLVVQ